MERTSPQSRVARLAALFRARPGAWFDGRALAPIAGTYAWRTRVSDLRRSPFNMPIENRQRHVRVDGEVITISEYRYVPVVDTPAQQPDLFNAESHAS